MALTNMAPAPSPRAPMHPLCRVVQPFDTTKTVLQASRSLASGGLNEGYRTLPEAMVGLVRTGGPFALYRGIVGAAFCC